MHRLRPLLSVALTAALVGALYGASEAMAVPLEGRLWIPSPALLVVAGALGGALLVALPGAILGLVGRGWTRGLAGGAAAITIAEIGLAVITDPPPFQEPAWYVGSPVALGVGLLLVGIFLGAGRVSRAVGPAWGGGVAMSPALAGVARRDSPPEVAASGERPNVLLVTSDTTRADRLAPYGNPRVKTPALSRLAAEGALFESAFAQIAVTGPSHTGIFSGAGTWNHGTLLNGIPIQDDQPLLPERLQAAGYHTGAFVSAYVLEAEMGFSRGFSTYDDDFSWLKGGSGLLAGRLLAGIKRRISPDEVLERLGGDTVDAALSWLEATPAERPWFLWVHLFDPHGPYAPPPPYDTLYYSEGADPRDPANTSMEQVENVAVYLEESLEGITDLDYVLAQYDGEISYMDAQVGRLLKALDARGEADDTLVVFAADHGESLGEHDYWFNHGDDVFDPSMHVPLILRLPGALPAGARVEELVELTDIAPTITELVGVESRPHPDGRSLVKLARGEARSKSIRRFARSLIFDREANLVDRAAGAITKPRWRMVGLRSDENLYVYRDHEDYDEAIYGVPQDENVYVDFYNTDNGEEILGILADNSRALLEIGAEGLEHSGQEMSQEQIDKLRELGYME